MPDSVTRDPAAPDQQTRQWLVEEFASQMASVFEAMAGARPEVMVELEPDGGAEQKAGTKSPENISEESAISHAFPEAISAENALLWKQVFSSSGASLPGILWLGAAETDWTAAGTHILRAAGIGPEDTDAASVRSSYVETLGQALGGVAQAMSSRLGREVTPAGGDSGESKAAQDFDPAAKPVAWATVRCDLAGVPLLIYVAADQALLGALKPVSQPALSAQPLSKAVAAGSESSPENEISMALAGRSKTFNLLLDVELPVSVSFGGAEVSLKEVLKLTTGSIVELNRTILEPVDIIVNNRIIARGEVVVIEGNFGVRVQEVASKQERLRTLR